MIELKPKISGEAQMHERQGEGCGPVPSKLLPGLPAPAEMDERADDCTVAKPEHGMVALVVPDPNVIHVVGQANDKIVTFGNRRDFDQWNRTAGYQIPEHCDMQIQGGKRRMGRRLADREPGADLMEQIKSDGNRSPIARIDFRGGRAPRALIRDEVRPAQVACRALSDHWNT